MLPLSRIARGPESCDRRGLLQMMLSSMIGVPVVEA